ncbi:F-box/LRR-repeat/kelch-repeat protein [Raphanus sativus]|uniref:F-box/LRR-repeat/kelch-repeat protein At1g09650-like n=1 Tax=Raphanus sativus TaxID=3726 RepID=A0A6J0N3E4_RAPSA|nr:F-box/LRR-repeat/kelch-repeat protein At1g09650-like [Raphanus sativus]KAJ4900680.1 F-box/LRR-repeat/kelch-repeat protein [Raphanus sativus]
MARKTKLRRIESVSVPHHVVELIMERLPVKSLLSFKAVSKQWKSTIESGFFQERQLKHRQQSGDQDVLMVSSTSLRTLVFGSLSSSSSVKIPWGNEDYLVCQSSVDGLLCLYDTDQPGFVVNPTTGWYRPLPLSRLQQLIIGLGDGYYKLEHANFDPGFGKDEFTGTHKPVWLYNSFEIGLENATTCEVFDFQTNSWRYVTPSAPCRILGGLPTPVFVDGSLHWFTECEETKVLSFDLRTETFKVISKAPFASNERRQLNILLCNLNNRLCVSQKKKFDQVIWSFNSFNKTWDKLWSIDINRTRLSFGFPSLCALSPLAIFVEKEKKKKKLLFYDQGDNQTLVIHDPETQSHDVAFSDKSIGYPVCYFPSLISI